MHDRPIRDNYPNTKSNICPFFARIGPSYPRGGRNLRSLSDSSHGGVVFRRRGVFHPLPVVISKLSIISTTPS